MPIIETKNNPYTTGIAIIIVALLLCGAAGFFFIKPLYAERVSHNKDLEAQKELTKKMGGLLDQAKESFSNLESGKEVVERIDMALPAKPDTIDMSTFLEKAIRDAALKPEKLYVTPPDAGVVKPGVTVSAASTAAPPGGSSAGGSAGSPQSARVGAAQTTDPNKNVIKANLVALPISIRAKGSLDSLNQFLTTLEQSLVFYDVQKINVQIDAQSTDLGFDIDINSYYFQK